MTISLKVAKNAAGDNAHIIHVQPVANAQKLRLLAWIRHNRQQIAAMSHGQIGYVYFHDMEATGMREFVRQYYSQIRKPGIIFDARWNAGGGIDPLLFNRLNRRFNAMFVNRHGWADPTPSAPAGRMAALINRATGSDGDIFAYMFKQDGLGPTIGSRTWGGVRGYNMPFTLLDGGELIVSELGFYGLDSKWKIENIGVFPDITVHDQPGDLNAGHDTQIEKAVSVLMHQIKNHQQAYPPPPAWTPAFPPQPDYPDCGSPRVGNGACD